MHRCEPRQVNNCITLAFESACKAWPWQHHILKYWCDFLFYSLKKPKATYCIPNLLCIVIYFFCLKLTWLLTFFLFGRSSPKTLRISTALIPTSEPGKIHCKYSPYPMASTLPALSLHLHTLQVYKKKCVLLTMVTPSTSSCIKKV